MAQQDLAQIRATQAWIDTLKTLLQAVIDHLATKAVSLTVEQRKRNPSIGPENLSMVTNGVAIVRDNAGWFPGTFARGELLLDVTDRELFLLARGLVLQLNEMYDDTLHAVNSDIVRSIRAARPYIEQGAELTGMNNDVVDEFLDWFKRFGPGDEDEEEETPPTPPTP